jgi:hypothetical protein
MPKVKHIAVFEFKKACSAEDQTLFWKKIEALPKQIPGILEYSGGPNVSSEGLNQGFTHSFVMTFESVAARDTYLPHPIHQAAVEIVIPMLERVVIIDHAV